MFSRFRFAIWLTLLLALLTSTTVLAKGGFAFITIVGPNLKEPIRSNEPALTLDFFAFADFYRDRTEAPAEPGVGYEITRYYVDGKLETAFDRLRYYPDSGYVYYDGILNGSSEYDDEWYTAKPEISAIFQNVLAPASNAITKSEPSTSQSQPIEKGSLMEPASPATGNRSILLVAGVVSLIAAALLVYLRRRSPAHL